MNQQPQTDPPEVWTLERECLALVRAIARRPGAIKLLLGAKQSLEFFAKYKGDRPSIAQRRRPGRGGKSAG